MAALLYWRAQSSERRQAAAAGGSEEAERDSAAELHTLHQQPSQRFCSLPPPLVCAHGGDATSVPPNSAAAFLAAIAGGTRCVEVDVARTKDGKLVVLHSRELLQLLRLAGRPWPPLKGAAAAQPQGAAAWMWGWGWRRRRQQRHQQHHPPPQAGDFTWADLSTLRWGSSSGIGGGSEGGGGKGDGGAAEGEGEGVAEAEAVVRLVAPHTDHITLDLKVYDDGGDGDGDGDVLVQQVLDLVRRTACGHCLVWAKQDAVVSAEGAGMVGFIGADVCSAPSASPGASVTSDQNIPWAGRASASCSRLFVRVHFQLLFDAALSAHACLLAAACLPACHCRCGW